jgi:hypothetical protein
MIVMSRTNLVYKFRESGGSCGEEWAAAMGTTTEIVVKLVSPDEAREV